MNPKYELSKQDAQATLLATGFGAGQMLVHGFTIASLPVDTMQQQSRGPKMPGQ